MLEELEAKVVFQMFDEEAENLREGTTQDHLGVAVQVRGHRRQDGATLLRYSYDGARLERTTPLLLLCPESQCERSISVKKLWKDRTRESVALERGPRSTMHLAYAGEQTSLSEEVKIEMAGRAFFVRPAAFRVLIICTLKAHPPYLQSSTGSDIFRNGKYVAGGLKKSKCGSLRPVF